MATKFLEPGGDATFNAAATTAGGFWQLISNGATVATDFVHGSHVKSLKFGAASGDLVRSPSTIITDAGGRISFYVYFAALPTSTATFFQTLTGGNSNIVSVRLTSAGVLQLAQGNTPTQIGSNGSTLSTGTWYRISLAFTLTDGTTNEWRLFKNGVLDITVSNATINNTSSSKCRWGNADVDTTLDTRVSDIYVDDSTALTDPGNIWVTAKRPNANGTTNGFTASGTPSGGTGSGNAQYVSERPLNTSALVSVVAVGATTEEYNIESVSTGDISITGATIVDFVGWVYAKALLSETASIVLAGSNSNIALTSTATMFTKVAGSSTYPPRTGTDIGVITDATATTVSLYECGVMVAYIPAPPVVNGNFLSLL